ncbi:PEP-CTERM sorting domain-containing protein [Frankia sp. RB7]|nr:PEP-CTERM sorting domain-containing protein [Frankia sp. RB7]
MLSRSFAFAALLAASLASSSALAGVVGVTSYDMVNGNGADQYTTPTGGQNYFDFTYTKTGQSTPDPAASMNGSSSSIPNNSNATNLLTGGKGMLTDGVIATDNYSLVSGSNGKISNGWTTTASPYYGSLNGQPSQYVGWKYQDPTIAFHLASGSLVSQINLYVAANNSLGLVGAPSNVAVTIGSTILDSSQYTETISPYTGSNPYGSSTDVITIILNQAISSSDLFTLQLFRGILEQDGYDYENTYWNASTNTFNDPLSGFQENAWNTKLEPWIMLSEVQFLTSAVPEPSTWIMMIAGFFGLGILSYRRRPAEVRLAA